MTTNMNFDVAPASWIQLQNTLLDLRRRLSALQTELDTTFALYQLLSQKNAASGYAGLNASSRTTKGVDAADDLIVDTSSKGLVLKDAAGTPHYWRVKITAAGALTTTDLGTSKP